MNSALELNKNYGTVENMYVPQITVCDNGHTHLTTHAATVYANKVQSMSSILRLTVTTSLGLVCTPDGDAWVGGRRRASDRKHDNDR